MELRAEREREKRDGGKVWQGVEGGCIETVPQRDNSNGVVKIERGMGIRGKRVREKDEG